jgi:hypothetical protein
VNSGSIQLLRFYDRGLQRDRALLFGRDEQGIWRVTEPFSELVEYAIDFLHNAGNLVFLLASEYSEAGRNDELRVLLLDSGQWTSLELEEFPAELASLVSRPYQYCCMSGDPDNFVLKTTRDTRLLHFDRRESAGWQVGTVELPIRVVENTRAGNDWIALKGNVLMVVEPFKDGELPDQGEVSLYHLGADGQWTLEASIAGEGISLEPAAILMREELALVQKRIYRRVQPGMWQPVAGINTDQQILNAFVRDDLLFWSASRGDGLKRIDIASWGGSAGLREYQRQWRRCVRQ